MADFLRRQQNTVKVEFAVQLEKINSFESTVTNDSMQRLAHLVAEVSKSACSISNNTHVTAQSLVRFLCRIVGRCSIFHVITGFPAHEQRPRDRRVETTPEAGRISSSRLVYLFACSSTTIHISVTVHLSVTIHVHLFIVCLYRSVCLHP